MPVDFQFTVEGVEAVQRAFKELPKKLAKKVIRQAQRKGAKIFAQAIRANAPVGKTGKLKKSIKVRSSIGTKTFPKAQIAIAVLVGEAGRKGDKGAGIRRPFYTHMQEKGWTAGKRIKRGGKVVGYKKGITGPVRRIPGKHFAKRALVSKESQVRALVISEILEGIEREAKQG